MSTFEKDLCELAKLVAAMPPADRQKLVDLIGTAMALGFRNADAIPEAVAGKLKDVLISGAMTYVLRGEQRFARSLATAAEDESVRRLLIEGKRALAPLPPADDEA